jgi:biotin operon repressor
MQKIWSHKETEKLKKYMNDYPPISSTQIAEEMGRSVDSVRHKIKWMRKQDEDVPVKKAIPTKKTVAKPVVTKAETPTPESKTARTGKVPHISYPPLEWCPTCHSPVSNWEDHRRRLGCVRPAA